jgi:hypothetical protein
MNGRKKKSVRIQTCTYDTFGIGRETIRRVRSDTIKELAAHLQCTGLQSAIDFWLFFY